MIANKDLQPSTTSSSIYVIIAFVRMVMVMFNTLTLYCDRGDNTAARVAHDGDGSCDGDDGDEDDDGDDDRDDGDDEADPAGVPSAATVCTTNTICHNGINAWLDAACPNKYNYWPLGSLALMEFRFPAVDEQHSYLAFHSKK